MISTVPTTAAPPAAGPPAAERMGVVRRRRSTAGRLDALTRLEGERSRLARQAEWSSGRAVAPEVVAGTPVRPS